jgi:required for meiotic nuclear division protein 1
MQFLPLSAVFRHARLPNVCRVAAVTASGSSWLPHRFFISATTQRRGYASEVPQPHGQSSSLKPKAHTPLRRTASDSLSIRTNPKPTQSEIQPISTLATAERYLLTRLRTRLPPALGARPLHDAYWVPKWSSCGGGEGKREGEVFIFGNGSFVCWGLAEEDAMRFRRDVLIPANAEVGTLAEPETEELEFATDPSECVSF